MVIGKRGKTRQNPNILLGNTRLEIATGTAIWVTSLHQMAQ